MSESVTIEFDTTSDSNVDEYSEDGFNLALFTPVPGGLGWRTDGPDDGYMINFFSSNTIILTSATPGESFGLQSIDLDGFVNVTTADGVVTEDRAVVFHFRGITVGGDEVLFDFTTDTAVLAGGSTFQTLSAQLPDEFNSGLRRLTWTVDGGASNAWGAFDNIVLTTNAVPTVDNLSTTVTAGNVFTGHLTGADGDNDPLNFHIVGGVPQGVVVSSNGDFTVSPIASDFDLAPGGTRTFSFNFVASDGQADSQVGLVTITVKAPDAVPGQVIIDPKHQHPNNLVGTAGNDTMFGQNNNDTLTAGAGDDKLYGGNDRDLLFGENGRDTLSGDHGDDVLNGGRGNDRLIGGVGKDVFVFDESSGDDVVVDFDTKHDVMNFQGVYTDFADAINHAQVTADGVKFRYTGDDNQDHFITVSGVNITSLKADDFLFT
jgi:Ca2+-binding RTX toxin-like protein